MLKELKSCPFVVDLKYTFQDHKNLYMVSEYLSCESLQTKLQSKLGFPNAEFKFYICEIIVALQSIHSKNIIYRNLIMENVIIDAKGHIKLIDF